MINIKKLDFLYFCSRASPVLWLTCSFTCSSTCNECYSSVIRPIVSTLSWISEWKLNKSLIRLLLDTVQGFVKHQDQSWLFQLWTLHGRKVFWSAQRANSLTSSKQTSSCQSSELSLVPFMVSLQEVSCVETRSESRSWQECKTGTWFSSANL